MDCEKKLKTAIGKADACELLTCAFAYPDEQLAEGLCNGSLADDVEACLLDAGADESVASDLADGLRVWAGSDVPELRSHMRKTYSRLYFVPGGHTPIFPYESAFLHVERDLPGAPALFRTSVTLDVERHMREAGVAAKNARTEPCDSVFEEYEFLSYLYAKQADAIASGDVEGEVAWAKRIEAFVAEHVSVWIPSFMARTRDLAKESPYEGFALLALVLAEQLSA